MLVPSRFECRWEIVQFGQLCLQCVGTCLLDGEFLAELRDSGLRTLKPLVKQAFGNCSFFSEARQLLLSLLGLLACPIHFRMRPVFYGAHVLGQGIALGTPRILQLLELDLQVPTCILCIDHPYCRRITLLG
ncbi:hypothetical protein FD63_09885 [Xanthomonas translucens pv. undulosa]|nr:hypothetical protein FD63_09885 [Xanthomonas translucens pv. undulosa]